MSGENGCGSGQPGVGVAEDQPAGERREFAEVAGELIKCPDCGKQVKARGLGIHRAKAHGVHGKAGSKPKKAAGGGRKGPLREEGGVSGLDVAKAFEAIRRELRRSDELVQACLDGLEVVTDEALKLRLGYLQKSDRLAKLLAKGQEMKDKQRKRV